MNSNSPGRSSPFASPTFSLRRSSYLLPCVIRTQCLNRPLYIYRENQTCWPFVWSSSSRRRRSTSGCMAFNRLSLYRNIFFEFITRCPRFVCANSAICFSFLLLSASKQLRQAPIIASFLLRWMSDSYNESGQSSKLTKEPQSVAKSFTCQHIN